jgi:hypothetical protein
LQNIVFPLSRRERGMQGGEFEKRPKRTKRWVFHQTSNAFNSIAARAGGERVIPSGSTYKIRGREYFFRGKRVFPSYLQAGPSFFIEKSKRKMIAEDIACALSLVR